MQFNKSAFENKVSRRRLPKVDAGASPARLVSAPTGQQKKGRASGRSRQSCHHSWGGCGGNNRFVESENTPFHNKVILPSEDSNEEQET